MHVLYLSIKIILLTENEENWLDINSWLIWAHGTFANLLDVLLYPHGKISLSAAAAAVAPSLLEALSSSKSNNETKCNDKLLQNHCTDTYTHLMTSWEPSPSSYFERQRYNLFEHASESWSMLAKLGVLIVI